MGKNFSDKFIKNLKPQEKEYQVRDSTGFAIRVLPTGTKTFLFIFQVNGKRKYHNLGIYPIVSLQEAREKYNEATKALQRGEPLIKPLDPEPVKVLTVKDIIDAYMLDANIDNVAKWASIKDSILQKKLLPWHNRPIDSFSRQEAIQRIDAERVNGDGAMRTLYKVTRSLFQYAVDREYLIGNPFSGMRKVKPILTPASRERFLTIEEIQTVWKGISEGIGTVGTKRILKLILVTGQRPGEVAGLHRREISGDWWTIPAERAKKGKRDHRVFLTSLAKEIVGDSDGFIFPTTKHAVSGHISTIAASRIIIMSNFYGLPRWTPHDLRRTARTHMSRLRIPREHAEAVLNHAKSGMVKVYDQYEFDLEKQEALQKWSDELGRLLAQSRTSR
jgi:integrase